MKWTLACIVAQLGLGLANCVVLGDGPLPADELTADDSLPTDLPLADTTPSVDWAPLVIQVMDSFTAPHPAGFNMYPYGGQPQLVDFQVSEGMLRLTHQPREFYHSVNAWKEYSFNLSTTNWFHFRFRMAQQLLGQDMYTKLEFYGDPGIANPTHQFTIGINSEQHWKTVHFDGLGESPCTAKSCVDPGCDDDELFISTDMLDALDNRLRYPAGYRKSYTEWTVFSLKYEAPGVAHPSMGKLSVYVDGQPVTLTDLEGPTVISPYTTALSGINGPTRVKLTTTILIDGNDHAYTGNKYGVRGRGCYAASSPAFPQPLVYPSKFNGNDGIAYKTSWMKEFDKIAAVIIDHIRTWNVPASDPLPWEWILAYQPTRSALSPLDQSGNTNPQRFYCFYVNPSQVTPRDPSCAIPYNDIRPHISAAIWARIYSSGSDHVDFETAVLMGAIDPPPEGHVIYTYLPPGTRQALLARLNDMATYYPTSMSQPERFVWDTLYRVGGTADIVHFGYLTPEAVRASAAWNYLSAQEKADIPMASTPAASNMYWDYFMIQ